MTRVSAANIMDSDKKFILRAGSFIYIVKNNGRRTGAWGTAQVMKFHKT